LYTGLIVEGIYSGYEILFIVFNHQVGYRRHGHNEIDEPMFTQPIMYSIIKKHKNVLDKYSDQLVAEGVCTKEEVEAVVANYEQVNSLLDVMFEKSFNEK